MVRLSAAWSCFLALIAIAAAAAASSSNYPGVIELVGYSNRRARTYFQETPRSNPNPPAGLTSSAKTRADIETVKRNIRKYDRLLELDTKNLPEQQKDMLARIVERVARLKESLDIEEQQFNQQEATSSRSSSSSSTSTPQETQTEAETEPFEQSTQPPTGSTEAETDPTLILDETTLLELQNTMNEQAAMSTMMKELPTTTDVSQQQQQEADAADAESESEATEEGETTSPNLTTQSEAATTSDESLTDSTDPDDQFVAARSNNNIAAITAADDADGSTTTTTANSGSQQRTLTTMGKLKNRATKRPFAHKVTAALKRGGQRPSSVSAAAANAAAASKPSSSSSTTASASSTTQKQKVASTNFQQKQQQSKPLQKVTPSIGSSSSSAPSSSIPSATTNSAAPALPIEQLYTRTPQANIPLAAAAAAAAAGSAGSAGSGATPATYSSNQQDSMVYDAHVNASALIDSLNTNAREEYYQQKLGAANKDNKKTATAKPTKYHYYPHNQHIYLLPECAIQQVCNAVYVRLNYTQPLCACPSRYRDPCSASLNEDDQHTTKLVGDNKKKAIISALAKSSPRFWFALQNTRTGKSHYLVICRCPDHFKMEGPMAHDQPTYASVPGIRVFGMMCVKPGYSVRKPSNQPPKRYQLQKPFYRPSVGTTLGGGGGVGGGQKDSYGRPIYGGGSSSGSSAISSNYQPQDQSFQSGGSSSYQYLNRPESSGNSHSSANFRPDQFSINNFPGSNYGRNNERRGDLPPIEAISSGSGTGGTEEQPGSSTPAVEEEAAARTTLQAEQEAAAAEPVAPVAAELTTTAAEEDGATESRARRSLAETDDYEPEFPWDRVLEFQQSIIWD
nr:serine-rich adhesin for platelets [Drosophila takahashii]